MSPIEIWGPSVWNLFHTLSEKINDSAYPYIKKSLFNLIVRVCRFLPCPECASDASNFLAKINIENIKTKEEFKNTFYLFHNYVNAKKRKPLFNYYNIHVYQRYKLIPVVNNFIAAYNTKGNMKLLTESFQRQFVLKEFTSWFSANMRAFIPIVKPHTTNIRVHEPIVEEETVLEPVSEPHVLEESVLEPHVEEPHVEEPIVEEPIVEEPIVEEPIVEEPIVEEPISEEPVSEEPVSEEPVSEEPVSEEPVSEESIVEEPVSEEPVSEEYIVEEHNVCIETEQVIDENNITPEEVILTKSTKKNKSKNKKNKNT